MLELSRYDAALYIFINTLVFLCDHMRNIAGMIQFSCPPREALILCNLGLMAADLDAEDSVNYPTVLETAGISRDWLLDIQQAYNKNHDSE